MVASSAIQFYGLHKCIYYDTVYLHNVYIYVYRTYINNNILVGASHEIKKY